jgi:hypothetical protein
VHTAEAHVFVVSNDLMRDHHFRMLGTAGSQAFARWRERHQVFFAVQQTARRPAPQLRFRFPSIYSHSAQCSLDGRAWHFPEDADNARWLAVWS